jgi:hypothetical protein
VRGCGHPLAKQPGRGPTRGVGVAHASSVMPMGQKGLDLGRLLAAVAVVHMALSDSNNVWQGASDPINGDKSPDSCS